MKYQTFYLSLFLCLSLTHIALSTPVIIWSNRDHKLSRGSSHYLGNDVSFFSFDYQVLRSIAKETPDVIFVFVTSPLTLDDITKYGDVFSTSEGNSCIHNTKTAIHNSVSSLFIDEVTTGSVSILNNLRNSLSGFKDYSLVELLSNDELSDNLKLNDKSIVLIASAYPSLKESLSRTDEQISSFLQTADDKDLDYISILLGDDQPPKMHSLRAARAVTPIRSGSSSSSNVTLQYIASTNESAILFRAQNISVVMNKTADSNNTYYLFPNNTNYFTAYSSNKTDTYLEIVTTALGNDTMWLKFIFPTGLSKSNLTAILDIPQGYWSMYLELTLASNLSKAISLFSQKYQLIVPFGFSYHCTPTLRFVNIDTNSTEMMMITITGLQVQPYKVANDTKGVYKFSSADDCIGYFTIDIWMGIFTSFIIFSMLYCAIMATMSIPTSNRLDDPQGKPLMVEGTSH